MVRAHFAAAPAYPCREANSGLPGDVVGRDLQDLRRVRLYSGCRDQLSGVWRLATSRGRDGRAKSRIL